MRKRFTLLSAWISAFTVLSLVLPVFPPSALLTHISSKKWWFLLSAVFPLFGPSAAEGKPGPGGREPCQGVWPGQLHAVGLCMGELCLGTATCSAQHGLRQQRQLGQALGCLLVEWPHMASPVLMLCLPSLHRLPVERVDSWWVQASVSPIFFFFCQPPKCVFYSF